MPELRLIQKPHVASFHCTKCGACCNSAPQLSLPELFQHQRRFVGCLTVRRVERLQPGARPGATVTEVDCAAFDDFASKTYHQAGTQLVLLATQAFDEPALGKCPALTGDNQCSLQFNNKPLVCQSVPLEALLPDSLQLSVLAQRSVEAAYHGAECIQLKRRKDATLLVTGDKIMDAAARRAVVQRRTALAADRRVWGDAVFKLLRAELFDHPERVAGLPPNGYITLPLAPVLAVVASGSSRARARVIEYLTVQIELLTRTLQTLNRLTSPSERELSAFLRTGVALRATLQRDATEHEPSE